MSPHIWVSFFCTLCSYGAATSLDTGNTPNPRDRRELGGARRRNRERYALVNVTDSFWMKETRLQINAFFVYKASNVVVFQIQNRNKKIDKYRQELMSTWYKRQTAICTGLMSQCDFFFPLQDSAQSRDDDSQLQERLPPPSYESIFGEQHSWTA